tara:strand:- start:275 stop:472 length:198 start_codon:yes stop_codon:yes gene_type:complete
MSDNKIIPIYVALETASERAQKPIPPKQRDNRPHCDNWSHCNDPLCFSAGCRDNVFAIPDKGDQS